ncbi:MAG: hypothetical protein ABIM50_15615 [Novosphingobium sp.]
MADIPPSADLNARWQALTNGHYHSEREAFLGFVDRAITFLVLVAGASAVASSLDEVLQTVSTISVAIFALFQLVFAIGPSARRHASLREKYFAIASDIESAKTLPNEANAKMLLLAGEEMPIYAAVHALSEKWAKQAVYGSDATELCKVGKCRYLTRHIFRQSSHDFHSVA